MPRALIPVLILNASLASALLPAPAVAGDVTVHGVTISRPWLRATPEGATVGAAFMEIKTSSGTTDKLVGITTPVAGSVEIHTHEMAGDVMKMRRLEDMQLEAGKSYVLKPGGNHAMLFDLKRTLKVGDSVKLTLTFEHAGAVEVEGTVEPAGALGPRDTDQPADSGHDHDHTPGPEPTHERH